MSERYVNRHLVTIEIRVKCGTGQWVQLDRFSFDQFRLERLDTQSVECRGAVQQNRVSFQDVLEDIPNDRLFLIYNLLSGFNGLHNTTLDHLADDEWLE